MLQAACAPFPEVAASQADTGTYPALLPIDELLAQAVQQPADPASALAARAAALRARSAALTR
jgi:hypothetical protein